MPPPPTTPTTPPFDNDCPICRGALESEEYYAMWCGHRYHRACCDEERLARCAICRRPNTRHDARPAAVSDVSVPIFTHSSSTGSSRRSGAGGARRSVGDLVGRTLVPALVVCACVAAVTLVVLNFPSARFDRDRYYRARRDAAARGYVFANETVRVNGALVPFRNGRFAATLDVANARVVRVRVQVGALDRRYVISKRYLYHATSNFCVQFTGESLLGCYLGYTGRMEPMVANRDWLRYKSTLEVEVVDAYTEWYDRFVEQRRKRVEGKQNLLVAASALAIVFLLGLAGYCARGIARKFESWAASPPPAEHTRT